MAAILPLIRFRFHTHRKLNQRTKVRIIPSPEKELLHLHGQIFLRCR